MRIISFIQDQEIIEKMLKQLGLWLTKPKVPPKGQGASRTALYQRKGIIFAKFKGGQNSIIAGGQF
jgi:hypothetical protein